MAKKKATTTKAKPRAKKKTGPKKGTRKPSKDELEQRYEFTAEMVARKLYRHQVRAILRAKYKISRATADNYVSRAKEIVAGFDKEKTTQEKWAESTAYYNSVIADPNETTAMKLKAQGRLDNLAGRTVTRIALTDADGRTLTRDSIELKIADLAALVARRTGIGDTV